MVSYIQLMQLVGFALLMSTGQMLFKKTAISITALSNDLGEAAGMIDSIIRAIQIPWFYFALIIYGLSTVLWLYILQRIPLSIAYPFSALAMLIVPIFSFLIFKERLSYSYFMGSILIVSGIAIISR
jgi:drug/metabolite transporter (DMT)-like permease